MDFYFKKYNKNFFLFKVCYFFIKFNIKNFLYKYLFFFSKNDIKNLIISNCLLVNNNIVKKIFLIKYFFLILFKVNNILNKIILNLFKFYVPVIYEDINFIVINKPFGILIHFVFGDWNNTLINCLLYYYKKKILHLIRFGFLCRLDKNTSGIMVLSKFYNIYIILLKQMLNKIFLKYYFTLALGNINCFIFKIKGIFNLYYKKNLDFGLFKENHFSITNFYLIRKFKYINNFICLLKCNPLTGKTHQIRIHLSYINCPILGDHIYNFFNKIFKGQFLNLYYLHFFNPILKIVFNFNVNLNYKIKNFIKKIRNEGIRTLDL